MAAFFTFCRTLERTLGTLALPVGSALPFALAWILIASTDDDATPQNPLERIPDYGGPPAPDPAHTPTPRYIGRRTVGLQNIAQEDTLRVTVLQRK